MHNNLQSVKSFLRLLPADCISYLAWSAVTICCHLFIPVCISSVCDPHFSKLPNRMEKKHVNDSSCNMTALLTF